MKRSRPDDEAERPDDEAEDRKIKIFTELLAHVSKVGLPTHSPDCVDFDLSFAGIEVMVRHENQVWNELFADLKKMTGTAQFLAQLELVIAQQAKIAHFTFLIANKVNPEQWPVRYERLPKKWRELLYAVQPEQEAPRPEGDAL